MARLSRRLWGGTSIKTAAKEARTQVEACLLDQFVLFGE